MARNREWIRIFLLDSKVHPWAQKAIAFLCNRSKQKFLEPNNKDNWWGEVVVRIVKPHYYRLSKSYPFVWIPHFKTPISGIILLLFRIQVPLCHSMTDHQIALTTLSMQIYQQRLGGSLPETWQQCTEGGHQHGHQSSNHSRRIQ